MVSTLYRFTPASACSRATSVRCFHPVPSAATSTTVSDRSITSGSSAYAAAGAAPGAGACAKDWKESEAGTRAARIQNFRAGVCMGVPGIAEAMVRVEDFCRRQIARRAREVRRGRLPDAADAELVEFRVEADDGDVERQGLGGDDAVEGVAVVRGETTGA